MLRWKSIKECTAKEVVKELAKRNVAPSKKRSTDGHLIKKKLVFIKNDKWNNAQLKTSRQRYNRPVAP